MSSVTSVQYSGILNNGIRPKNLEEKLDGDKIKKKFDDEKEEVVPIKEMDSRAISEYNPDGHYREDYNTEKHLDIFA
ncbi:MAG: hypothetical protein PHQ66_03435 [Candidatus Nanoarchaeia archaeon]|nr:hypothetical protein [Candidatus Nanoarchaeia archaeon]MDD5357585.1 hypothetical protein [Candidatus Nanoarchaeia archaeon]MDD5588504.1 hypothetical protein [Candidatus Nanoarchaeia archaeon]